MFFVVVSHPLKLHLLEKCKKDEQTKNLKATMSMLSIKHIAWVVPLLKKNDRQDFWMFFTGSHMNFQLPHHYWECPFPSQLNSFWGALCFRPTHSHEAHNECQKKHGWDETFICTLLSFARMKFMNFVFSCVLCMCLLESSIGYQLFR